MQSQQMAMGMNANMGGPVGEGTPIMGNAQRPNDSQNSQTHLNTYIYDYFKQNKHFKLAQLMIDSGLDMNLQQPDGKRSPNPRNVNGVGAADNLPDPKLPDHQLADNSFLHDWWCQFWDIWGAARSRSSNAKSLQYINHSRNLAQMQTEQRTQRMLMNGGMNAQYQNMMRGMPNGVAPNANDLKRAAAMNSRNPNGANPMANVNQMKNQAMMAQQMQRDGSQMDMNGQRPQSPGSTENAPSPNKRPRVEGNYPSLHMAAPLREANHMQLAGGMNQAGMAGNQFTEFAQQGQGLQQKTMEGMNAAVQGSPMNQQGLDGHDAIFAGNPQRPGMPAAPGAPQGNHALQDYQMQLMLLEQQNKKRLLMARQEQDSMSGGPPQGHSGVGAPGFPPAMSPQGSRAGPSPNPTDQMKRGTPKMNQQGLPGSPMPDAAMQQQRNSPVPFDPSQMPPGMPPQFAAGYPQIPGNPMMRPPSSHPGNFNGQMNQAQMEAMRRNPAMQNGGWPQGGPPQAMMQNQGQPMGGPGGPMNNPQQRNNMPPPPAPPAGEQPRAEPSPSQPAAPPTPSQQNKAGPKKKGTKDNAKKPANKKGANAGANPAASSEDTAPTPTPSTPMTPVHPKSFNGPNGQPQAAPAPVQQPPAAPQQPLPVDNGPFGNLGDDNFSIEDLTSFNQDNTLDNFDFDSFLHVGDDPSGFGLNDFTFGDTVEAGDGM
ncbi:hypothetical protein BDV96DRAFT_92927 [Lophiotrema nucula]|uniref:LisH domain-containing protein n=1 Tax=Lophiotrema nucula TaxID=690887 RepID=A0A6A5Z6J3_9PLEO|nr:hypothetical protein BDV96DRAFT_92927 [Lophiotrema nucula]